MKHKVDCELSGYGELKLETGTIDVGSREEADRKARDMALSLEIKKRGVRGPFWQCTVRVIGVQPIN